MKEVAHGDEPTGNTYLTLQFSFMEHFSHSNMTMTVMLFFIKKVNERPGGHSQTDQHGFRHLISALLSTFSSCVCLFLPRLPYYLVCQKKIWFVPKYSMSNAVCQKYQHVLLTDAQSNCNNSNINCKQHW